MTKRFGFTLAEVLITLGIIGIVASMTIPVLMNNTQDAEFKSAYKKALSDANSAWTLALANDEIVARTAIYDPTNDKANFVTLQSHFSVTKDCTDDISECWPTTETGTFWGAPLATTNCFIDKSGRTWALWQQTLANTYANIFVDVNGSKKPNQYGKDRFPLHAIVNNNEDKIGIITSFKPFWDITSATPAAEIAARCPSSPCYYTSWITGAK